MKKEIDCQIFEDQLDELLNGSLPDEGVGQLQFHALSCPDCGMLLKVQEHLTLPTLEELERATPEELLASIWHNVQAGVKVQPVDIPADLSADVSSEKSDLPSFRWLIPILAAASVVLLFSTGFLFSELKRTEARGNELAQQVGELERGLAEFDERTEAVARTAGLPGRNTWVHALSLDLDEQGSVSVERVQQVVGRLPPDTPLLTASQVDALLGGTLSRGLSGFRAEVSERAGVDGLSARELLAVFDSLRLDPNLTIPTSRLRELLS